MNYIVIQKSLKNVGPVVMKFLVTNKDSILKFLPYGACAGMLGYGAYKSNEQKEKDRLYQEQLRRSDAMIKDLKNKAERVDRLECLNEVLLDTLTKYKQTDTVEA